MVNNELKINADFLGIGAQKSATTWLNFMFESHPEIWVPPVKELQFFNDLLMDGAFKWTSSHRKFHAMNVLKYQINSDDPDWNRIRCAVHIAKDEIDIDWYREIFNFAPEDTIKGEITPEYSLLPERHVKSIVEANPDLKVFLIMREPFERAKSAVRMNLSKRINVKECSKSEINEEALKEFAIWDALERGNYQKIIETWSKYIKKDNFFGYRL